MRARGRREQWAAGSSIQEEQGGVEGAGRTPGVAEPLPPCAPLSSNGKTTRPVWPGYCELFIAAAQLRSLQHVHTSLSSYSSDVT